MCVCGGGDLEFLENISSNRIYFYVNMFKKEYVEGISELILFSEIALTVIVLRLTGLVEAVQNLEYVP